MHKKFLGAAAVVALASAWITPALAAPSPMVLSGYVDTNYMYSSANNGGGNANTWNIDGAALVPVAPHFALQLNGGYNNVTASHGFSENAGNVVGSGMFADSWGRVGASVGYAQVNAEGANANAVSYGGFADWYAGDIFTLSARGGGLSGTANVFDDHGASFSGYYVGGQAIGYIMHDFAVAGTIDYFNIPVDHSSLQSTSYGIGGEFLVSHEFPLAVSAGYTYGTLQVGNGPHSSESDNTFSVGLKYYFGGGGSLEDHQRSGAEGWGAAAPIKSLLF